MLYEAFRMAVERQEVLPSQDDFVDILNELSSSLLHSLTLRLTDHLSKNIGDVDKKAFSGLSDDHFDALLVANKVHVVGDLDFTDTEKLLENMEVPNSLIEQIQFLTSINVTSVRPFCNT
jgi:hypothetical protein